jgi:hypothetical protein
MACSAVIWVEMTSELILVVQFVAGALRRCWRLEREALALVLVLLNGDVVIGADLSASALLEPLEAERRGTGAAWWGDFIVTSAMFIMFVVWAAARGADAMVCRKFVGICRQTEEASLNSIKLLGLNMLKFWRLMPMSLSHHTLIRVG